MEVDGCLLSVCRVGKTVKQHNELIKGFIIRKQEWDFSRFFKVGRRKALAISIVNGVINLSFDDEKNISSARITLGAVAPTPVQIADLEKELIGKRYSDELGAYQKSACRVAPILIFGSKEYQSCIGKGRQISKKQACGVLALDVAFKLMERM